MRRNIIFLILVTAFTANWSLFAGGSREAPTRNNIYAGLGSPIYTDGKPFFNFGAGYEGAIGKSFSLGGYFSLATVDGFSGELLVKPRFYFGQSSLENFFIGANLGYFHDFYNHKYDTFITGLNTGYKFVFGSKSAGFSLEPSIGYDFLPNRINIGRINIGLSMGFAFGGVRQKPAPLAVRDGIYIGIITFGPDAEDITDGNPVYLDQQGEGMARLNGLLDAKYQGGTTIGTALFYSAHLALANMKRTESKIPGNDLENVTLFTFTDGLDVSSTGFSLPAINDPGNVNHLEFAGVPIKKYMEFVKGEIDNRKINGTSITARIVAVPGDDVTDRVAFSDALHSLATNDKYIRESIDMTSLNKEFSAIAKAIVNEWTLTSFTMITPEYAPGTRVRMTFDPVKKAEDSRFYIDGDVTVRNNQYYLTNISYGGGINSNVPQGGEIKGIMGGNSVRYYFLKFEGYNLNTANLKQWLINAGNNVWQPNSEYNSAGASQLNVDKHNAFIYLVLDRSSSITQNKDSVLKVRQAAKDFIKEMHDAYWRN